VNDTGFNVQKLWEILQRGDKLRCIFCNRVNRSAVNTEYAGFCSKQCFVLVTVRKKVVEYLHRRFYIDAIRIWKPNINIELPSEHGNNKRFHILMTGS